MIEKELEVKLKSGLQSRDAAEFVQLASKYASDVFLEKSGRKVNAKSIMGLMSLAIASGTLVKLYVEGTDEEEAVEALSKYISEE